MPFVEANAVRVEVELEVLGVAVIKGVPLDPRYFRWGEPGRRPVINIALRRTVNGMLLVYVDDDVNPVGDVLPADLFGGNGQDGWQRLRLAAQTDAAAILNGVADVLGLNGEAPCLPQYEVAPHGEAQAVADRAIIQEVPIAEEPAPSAMQPAPVVVESTPVVVDPDDRRRREAARSYANRFGKDLTELARRGKLGPVIGRDDELRAVIEILCKKGKNAPLLIGEPGVGKSAVVEALAQRIVSGQVPPSLRAAQIIEVNLGNLIAGAGVQGELEDRIRRLVEEARNQPGLILFLDEMHMMNAPAMGGTITNMLKGDLARGTFKVVGATTYRDYKQHVEADGALARRFQNVLVDELSEAQTLNVLRGLRPILEAHHHVTIPDEVLDEAVSLSARYVGDRQLPDKAIDLLDQACARTVLHDAGEGAVEATIAQELPDEAAIEEAIRAGDYARAKQLHDRRATRNGGEPQ